MSVLATNRAQTIVRPIEPTDLPAIMRLVDQAWRIYLRLPPSLLKQAVQEMTGFLAEDPVGVRGFLIVELQPAGTAAIAAAGLRDSWHVSPYLDLILPEIEQCLLAQQISTLLFFGSATWLVAEFRNRGFETRDWIISFERVGLQRPVPPSRLPAILRSVHYTDLPVLYALDRQVFDLLWHKSKKVFSQAMARAASFTVAELDEQIVAYEWCELYQRHAHLTRLAVHPAYQGQGIGGQLLFQALTDVLDQDVNRITLNTQESNNRSRALYERFGFQDTKERMPVLAKALG